MIAEARNLLAGQLAGLEHGGARRNLDLDTVDLAQANIRLLSRELCRTRAEYQSHLPPGDRIIFDIA